MFNIGDTVQVKSKDDIRAEFHGQIGQITDEIGDRLIVKFENRVELEDSEDYAQNARFDVDDLEIVDSVGESNKNSHGTIKGAEIKAIAETLTNIEVTINKRLPYVALDEGVNSVYYTDGENAQAIIEDLENACEKFGVSESEYVLYYLKNAGVLMESKSSTSLSDKIQKVANQYIKNGYDVFESEDSYMIENSDGDVVSIYSGEDCRNLKESFTKLNTNQTFENYLYYLNEAKTANGESLNTEDVPSNFKFIEKSLYEIHKECDWDNPVFENSFKYSNDRNEHTFKINKKATINDLKGKNIQFHNGQFQRKIDEVYNKVSEIAVRDFYRKNAQHFSTDARLMKLVRTESINESNLTNMGYGKLAEMLTEEIELKASMKEVYFNFDVNYNTLSDVLQIESVISLEDDKYNVVNYKQDVNNLNEAKVKVENCVKNVIVALFV